MTGTTSLFVARDGDDNGTTPKGARLALGGLLTGNGASALDVRTGVLVDNGGVIVSGAADMTYNVRAFRAVTAVSASNGPTVGANDATVSVDTDAAPGSNSRIDAIWVRQHLVTGDGDTDTDVELEIGVTQGDVSASPSAPAIPDGALSLTQVTVPAGTTATNTLTFTRTHPWTVANGGVIPIITSTERDAITPYEGQTIYYTPDKQLQFWDGTSWALTGSTNVRATYNLQANQSFSSGAQATAGGFALDTANSDAAISTLLSLNTGEGAGVWTTLVAGYWRIVMREQWDANSSGHRYLYPRIDNVQVDSASAAPGNGAVQSLKYEFECIHLDSGQDVRMRAMENAGTLNLMGSSSARETYVFFEYLGA